MNPRTQLAVAATGVTLLSTTSLHAVFIDTAWVAPVVGVVLAVLAGAEIGSRLGQHLVARPVWRFVGSALGATFFVTAVYAHEGAIFGFIPRGHTWTLLNAMRHKAFTEIHDLPTPAPTYRAIMMVTAVGVAAVAIAVDQLSVRAPLIGLPLLALYSVPEWLSHNGTGWIPLALGGSGYVGLLIREGRDRTSRWGRTVTGASAVGRDRSAATAMSAAGWRIGAMALAVALVVPPLIPDLAHFNLAKGGGVSSSAVVHYDPVSQLGGDLHQGATIKQYTYQANDGAGHYLRFATLDQFNGSGFGASKLVADQGVDPTTDTLAVAGVAANVPTSALSTSIAITKQLGQNALPIPEGTSRLQDLDGSWAYEEAVETVFGPSQHSTVNQHYTATSKTLSPGAADLQQSAKLTSKDPEYAAVASQLTLPKSLPALVKQKSLAVTKGLTTPYEKAVAIQNFFLSSRFKYSLNGPPGSGYTALVQFLTTHPSGYCQQFADAMALMARAAGIPARVAEGFTTGVTAGNGVYVVNNHDAHAWPELYFKGIGWLRFEPTPRGDGTTAPPAYGQTTVSAIEALAASGAKGGTSEIPSDIAPKNIPHQAGGVGSTKKHSSFSLPFSGETLAWILAGIALVVFLIAFPVVRSTTRQRRLRSAGDSRAVALLAWRQTLSDAYDLGHVASVADSPRQAARRLTESASLTGSATASLERLARAVEKARYAQLAGESAGLLDAAAAVKVAMYANATRRTRLRAKTLPPSTVASLAESWARGVASVSRTYGTVVARISGWGNGLLRRPSTAPVAAQVEERPRVGAGH